MQSKLYSILHWSRIYKPSGSEKPHSRITAPKFWENKIKHKITFLHKIDINFELETLKSSLSCRVLFTDHEYISFWGPKRPVLELRPSNFQKIKKNMFI